MLKTAFTNVFSDCNLL